MNFYLIAPCFLGRTFAAMPASGLFKGTIASVIRNDAVLSLAGAAIGGVSRAGAAFAPKSHRLLGMRRPVCSAVYGGRHPPRNRRFRNEASFPGFSTGKRSDESSISRWSLFLPGRASAPDGFNPGSLVVIASGACRRRQDFNVTGERLGRASFFMKVS